MYSQAEQNTLVQEYTIKELLNQHCRLKLLISKIVLNEQEHFSMLRRKSILAVTVKVAFRAERAFKYVVYSIGIGPLFPRY